MTEEILPTHLGAATVDPVAVGEADRSVLARVARALAYCSGTAGAVAIVWSAVTRDGSALSGPLLIPFSAGVVLAVAGGFRQVAAVPALNSLRTRNRERKAASRDLMDRVGSWVPPRFRLASLLAVFAAGVAEWALGTFGPVGDPERHDGGFALNNHGSLTPITHAQYAHDTALSNASFGLGALICAGVAVILFTAPPGSAPRSWGSPTLGWPPQPRRRPLSLFRSADRLATWLWPVAAPSAWMRRNYAALFTGVSALWIAAVAVAFVHAIR